MKSVTMACMIANFIGLSHAMLAALPPNQSATMSNTVTLKMDYDFGCFAKGHKALSGELGPF